MEDTYADLLSGPGLEPKSLWDSGNDVQGYQLLLYGHFDNIVGVDLICKVISCFL